MHGFDPCPPSPCACCRRLLLCLQHGPECTKTIEMGPILERCLRRHTKDYTDLSSTPDQFKTFAVAVGEMQRTEPNYSARDLAEIRVPVAIVQSERDEFIKREHADYLARNIPGAELIWLSDVTHFAPLQRPQLFNGVLRSFLGGTSNKREIRVTGAGE